MRPPLDVDALPRYYHLAGLLIPSDDHIMPDSISHDNWEKFNAFFFVKGS